MSKWDKYRVQTPQSPSVNKWDKYKTPPVQEDGEMLSNIGNYLSEGVGKLNRMHNAVIRDPVLEGLVKPIVNLPSQFGGLLGDAIQHQTNEVRRKMGDNEPAPEIDLNSRIPTYDDLRGFTGLGKEVEPEGAGERVAANMSRTAASFTPFGLLGKGAGAKKALDLALAGGGMGATSGVMQEGGGVNPLVADLASTVVAPYAATKLNPQNMLNAFRSIPIKAMGLSPKSLDIKAAQAARDINVDLTAGALTDSPFTALADQWIGKTPFFGNSLKHKEATTRLQVENSIEDVLNKIGQPKSDEVSAKINQMYNQSRQLLPENAAVIPTNLDKKISKIKFESLSPTPDELSVKKRIDDINKILNPTSSILSPYGKIKIPLQKVDVNALVQTKQSFNDLIKWDTDTGVKNILKGLQHEVGKDIAAYGKTNPEWYKSFKEADSMYGKVAQREKVEKLLDRTVNAATDTLSYNALSKALNSKKNQKTLRRLDPEIFEKIQKIGTVAQAMAKKGQRVSNPSGTAITAATMGLVGMIFTNPMALVTGSGISGVIGAAAGSKLLTDKKFIDLAIKLAETPNKPNLVTIAAVNKRIKEITGYSALVLSKRINESGEEK